MFERGVGLVSFSSSDASTFRSLVYKQEHMRIGRKD